MRKHVKPADPAASIPDPTRKTDLPPDGRAVEWSVHWARLAARGDIVVTDLADEDGAEAKADAPKASSAKSARTATP